MPDGVRAATPCLPRRRHSSGTMIEETGDALSADKGETETYLAALPLTRKRQVKGNSADNAVSIAACLRLEELIGRIPWKKAILVLGDFNARVESNVEVWPALLGRHGIGHTPDNGQRLLKLCANQGLLVTNTFFAGNIRRRTSWRHPRCKHWHQLDLVLARYTYLKGILHT
ncbi:unnamed protein product [Lepidochelys kempii]